MDVIHARCAGLDVHEKTWSPACGWPRGRRSAMRSARSGEASVLHLFHALYASGQIRMRRIDGWSQLATVVAAHQPPELTRVA